MSASAKVNARFNELSQADQHAVITSFLLELKTVPGVKAGFLSLYYTWLNSQRCSNCHETLECKCKR